MQTTEFSTTRRGLALFLSMLLLVGWSQVAFSAEPEPIAWRPLTIPKALVVVGPWGDLFRWQESLHTQGILYHDAYRYQNGYNRPAVTIAGMSTSFESLLDYSSIVLVNVDAPALGPERLAAVERFVKHGGGLVVLGGSWAYSRGAYGGTVLAEMLPVEFPPQHRIPANPEGDLLIADKNATWGLEVTFADKPSVFYVQKIIPKPTASVELLAGNQPAFVSGTYGAGRVVACSLTVHGNAAGESLPFWEWKDWPKVLGHAVEWSSQNRPLIPTTKIAAEIRPLTADEIQQVKLEFQNLQNDFVNRFAAFPTEAAAGVLFDRLVDGKKFNIKLTPQAIEGMSRFAQPDWQAPLQKMASDTNPDRALRAVALELLGATRNPAVSKILLAALRDNDVAAAAIHGLRRLGDAKYIPELLALYERSADLSDFRNPDHAKASGPTAARNGALAVHAAVALYALGEREGVTRMTALYREIRLMRRIHANAAKRRVVDTDLTGQAIRKAIIETRDNLIQLENQLVQVAGPVPNSQREAFIEIARRAEDEAEIRWLSQALLLSPADRAWAPLANAQDGILRRLAVTLSK